MAFATGGLDMYSKILSHFPDDWEERQEEAIEELADETERLLEGDEMTAQDVVKALRAAWNATIATDTYRGGKTFKWLELGNALKRKCKRFCIGDYRPADHELFLTMQCDWSDYVYQRDHQDPKKVDHIGHGTGSDWKFESAHLSSPDFVPNPGFNCPEGYPGNSAARITA